MHIKHIIRVFLYFTFCLQSAIAQRAPFNTENTNFKGEDLVKGVVATEHECAKINEAVWAKLKTGEAECIRYWPSGIQVLNQTKRILIYIPSDQMSFDAAFDSYSKLNPLILNKTASDMQTLVSAPFILLSRPGIFGSSGEHKQRRRKLESQLMSAALDGIKQRYIASEFVIVGLSGGGHVLASLLGLRSDIVCAIPASSVSSPKLRWTQLGRTSDLTGFADSYEPLENLENTIFHPKLRVFVLGDLRDTNVPWSTQTPLADKLRELGVAVETINAIGSDTQHHFLGTSGLKLGRLCFHDVTTQEILEFSKLGLNG
jgi:hypothetical protein